MINILLSVRRPFSDKILSGEKEWDLRKNFPRNPHDVPITLWLYESGKNGKRAIIGKCMMSHYYMNLSDIIFRETVELLIKEACVTEEHLRSYMPCFAWCVKDPVRLSAAVPLSAIGLTRPPQSWQYITDEQAGILERRGK